MSRISMLLFGVTIGFFLSFLLRKLSSPCKSKINFKTFNFPKEPVEEYHVGIKQDFLENNHRPEANSIIKVKNENEASKNQLSSSNSEMENSKKLLIIGVMTARKYLHSRAIAVYNTWARDFPGKILFFAGGNVSTEDGAESDKMDVPDIPIVFLPNVDDSYPPQKKSFMMLKYMFENFGNEYEWFIRADDDVYFRMNKLVKFLRSLNSRKLFFIGQTGRGNQKELGKLHLADNENFCMGGPGMIFSQATIRKVAPHVPECLEEMYSTHEDVEVGRCVRRFAGISCTWAYEMQKFFYHNGSGHSAFTQELKQREVHNAITLHPIKHPNYFYRLHSYFQAREVDKLFYEAIQCQRDLRFASAGLNYSTTEDDKPGDLITAFDSINITGLNPSLRKFIPKLKKDILEWKFLGKSGFNSPNTFNPKPKINGAAKEDLHDVVQEMMEIINGPAKDRGRVIEFKELLYGYHRVDPLHGEDYVLDILMTYNKFRGKRLNTLVRRHAYVQRPFAPVQLRIVTSQLHPPTTNFIMIVPLAGRFSIFERFLQNFLYACDNFSNEILKGHLNLKLIVVYFGTNEEKETFLSFMTTLHGNDKTHPKCDIKVVHLNAEFSRGLGLETGISHCDKDDLLFLIDVDIVYSPEALKRILLNVKQGIQVYFPIVFSEYSKDSLPDDLKDLDSFLLSSDTGYWRSFGFGIAAFFKSDFQSVGGFDINIRGWGKEDVALFDKFLKTNLTIFRSPDPELIHMYHPVKCDSNLPHSQYEMCLGTQANTLGNSNNLFATILKNRNTNKKLWKITSEIFQWK